jgi:hypothetical protein
VELVETRDERLNNVSGVGVLHATWNASREATLEPPVVCGTCGKVPRQLAKTCLAAATQSTTIMQLNVIPSEAPRSIATSSFEVVDIKLTFVK